MFCKKNYLVLFIILSFSFADASIERYAALDIGSGKTKLTVGDVDIEKKQVVKIVYTEYKRIGFAEQLSKNSDGLLDDRLLNLAVEKINNLSKKANELGIVKIFGVATEAFRKAKNGSDFLNSLSEMTKISMKIISQEREAQLGFETAVQASQKPREKIISWDSGGGSLQLTTAVEDSVAGYLIPFGTSPATRLLLEIKGENTDNIQSPNPVTIDQAKAFVEYMHKNLPDPDQILINKLKDPNVSVVGIGNFSSTIGFCSRVTGKNNFTAPDLWRGIVTLLNITDDELSLAYEDTNVATALPRLLLTYSVMTKLGVESIEWVDTNGNGLGILVMDLL